MNVLFSSDDNYAQHLGAAIYSLLDSNRDCSSINIFVVDNGISEDKKQKLSMVVDAFGGAKICYISFEAWKNQLHLNMSWPISLSSYARLFMGSMLPESVDRILYLDCDMIVCQSLADLWNRNLEGKVIAAVQDPQNDDSKAQNGLQPMDPYFNAGMLLVDLKAWRSLGGEKKCLDYIEKKQGRVHHHDQGTLNGVFRQSWLKLPIKYNLMTIHFIKSKSKCADFPQDHAGYYSIAEVQDALQVPSILHYTPSLTTRPWVDSCVHPLKGIYWSTLDKTPWKGSLPEKDNSRIYVRIFNWIFRMLK